MPFRDLIDQDHAQALLRRAVARGRVAHAYLFVGPSGVGRTSAALAFAQTLLCRAGGDDACGRCAPCRKVVQGAHPDLRVVSPGRGESGAERRAVGIEQIREMRREAAYGPYEARYKVFIIEDAEAMRAEAASSLLKIVEEPPSGIVIILVAESAEALLPTLVSRSQPVRFSFVPPSEIARALVARAGVPEERARYLAALSGGRVGAALEAARTGDEPFEHRAAVLRVLDAAARGDTLAAFDAAEALARRKDAVERWLDTALLWVRDVVVWQETRDGAQIANLDARDEIAAWAGRTSSLGLRHSAAAIEEAKTALRRNLNARLVLETLFARLELAPPSGPAAVGGTLRDRRHP